MDEDFELLLAEILCVRSFFKRFAGQANPFQVTGQPEMRKEFKRMPIARGSSKNEKEKDTRERSEKEGKEAVNVASMKSQQPLVLEKDVKRDVQFNAQATTAGTPEKADKQPGGLQKIMSSKGGERDKKKSLTSEKGSEKPPLSASAEKSSTPSSMPNSPMTPTTTAPELGLAILPVQQGSRPVSSGAQEADAEREAALAKLRMEMFGDVLQEKTASLEAQSAPGKFFFLLYCCCWW
jgi:hypothetical protein